MFDDLDGIKELVRRENMEVKVNGKWCKCGQRLMPNVYKIHWNRCMARKSEPEQTSRRMRLRNRKEL